MTKLGTPVMYAAPGPRPSDVIHAFARDIFATMKASRVWVWPQRRLGSTSP